MSDPNYIYRNLRISGKSHVEAVKAVKKAGVNVPDRYANVMQKRYQDSLPRNVKVNKNVTLKITPLGGAAAVKFDYDSDRIRLFKEQFKTAKWNGSEWTVKGKTATQRLEKWALLLGEAEAKIAKVEARARDALAFDKKVTSKIPGLLYGGKSGHSLKTPYNKEIIDIIKSLPGRSYNAWELYT